MPSLGTPCQPFCQPPSLKRGRGPGPGQECHPGDLAEDTGLRERLRPHLWAPGGWGRGLSKSPKGHSCPSGGGSSPTCVRSPECLSAMQAVLRGRGWRCGGSVSGWHSPLGATAAGAGGWGSRGSMSSQPRGCCPDTSLCVGRGGSRGGTKAHPEKLAVTARDSAMQCPEHARDLASSLAGTARRGPADRAVQPRMLGAWAPGVSGSALGACPEDGTRTRAMAVTRPRQHPSDSSAACLRLHSHPQHPLPLGAGAGGGKRGDRACALSSPGRGGAMIQKQPAGPSLTPAHVTFPEWLNPGDICSPRTEGQGLVTSSWRSGLGHPRLLP